MVSTRTKAYSTWGLLVPTIVAHLDPESAAKYESIFQCMFSMSVEQSLLDTERQEELWKQTQESYESIQSRFVQAEKRYGAGKLIWGDDISFPTLPLRLLLLGSLFSVERIMSTGENRQGKRGSVGNMLERLKPYLLLRSAKNRECHKFVGEDTRMNRIQAYICITER